MAYIKNNWVDREGITRYFESVDSDGAKIFTPDYTQVTELGTPVNADNMNHIEEGIAAGSFTKYDTKATYALNDLVTVIEDASPAIYKSLQDNNIGNALSDSVYWEKISLGGGTGLQMFDTILKDHILTYEESQGLALQGTYVYKEALAGSRYGYPDFYAKCLEEFKQATTTETLNGVTVKVHSNGHKFYNIADKTGIDEFFNTMGTAWFYGVDTANERIFLPRDKYFAVTGDVSVAGNGMTLGLTNGTDLYGGSICNTAGQACLQPVKALYGANIGTSSSYNSVAGCVGMGVTTDPTKSGIEGKLTSNTDKYLYICVGNTTNYEGVTEVVNQGMEILEQINAGFVPKDSMREVPCIVETYVNGSSWYRVWSDGWCEQGGYLASTSTNHLTRTVTFLKPFKDTTYNYQQTTGTSLRDSSGHGVQWGWISGTKTTTSIQTDTASATYQEGFNWQASGYIA